MHQFSYKIYYIDESNPARCIHEQGFVAATSHKDAMDFIANFFGDDFIIEVTLSAMEEMIRLPKDIHERIEQDDFAISELEWE